jgi:hypothetical protein
MGVEKNHDMSSSLRDLSVDEYVPPAYIVEAERHVSNIERLNAACVRETELAMDGLVDELERMVSGLSSSVSDTDAVESRQKVEGMVKDTVSRVSKVTKALHSGVAKYGKHVDGDARSVDLAVVQKIFGVTVAPDGTGCLPREVMKELIVEHFYVTRDFECGDCLAEEAGVPNAEEIKKPYLELLRIENELKRHSLEDALAWVAVHEQQLQGGVGRRNRLGFLLHRLSFLDVLEREGRLKAIEYGKRHLREFYFGHASGLYALMGGMLFYGGGSSSMDIDGQRAESHMIKKRYKPVYGDQKEAMWEEVVEEFRKQYSRVMGKPLQSPLLVSVAAGSAVLPTLLKYAKVAEKTKSAGTFAQTSHELPVELPLPDEFYFHSTFACPVSKESNTPSDPPQMLPCGHCLNKSSIYRIAKSATRRFKCPYCPQETVMTECKDLHLF